MTPPDDRSGQYGVPYPGTGLDAFGAPGVGHGQPYEQQQPYAPHGYGQQQQQYSPYGDQQYAPPVQAYPPGPEAFPEQAPPVPAQAPGHVDDFDAVDDYDNEESGPLIRPFAMTGGRTRPRYELALEALVSASVDADRLATLLPEHQRICTLCTEVKSVAEVSALLNIPLGVARILVADLAEAGLVAIHQPAAGGESGNQPDVTLLERVLSGLRKL
ncbi:hypothetical protein CFP65_5097 [Kitasatospora sp. MMS16-BH015]|uniref:DUF742 domain-containing protein n=1 Tax=Kitasatospora sp. MMS16-BH015 TaxID=2018025 RepID=UPI000CA15169|nr:DUF742 domain-containing protein [Kitasatospora sp. MMS16-BH015]AUG79808.1 hypothetical protein CFP65_5097 [Kitasatospora sp. MMS16-BH015]